MEDIQFNEEIKVENLFNFTYDPLKEALQLISKQLAHNSKALSELNTKVVELESKPIK
jgi:hypothetical protein